MALCNKLWGSLSKHLAVSEMKNKINDGDNSIAKKVLYFGASLRETTQ
jgi:hypothetical protein